MNVREIEDRFLAAIDEADFLFVCNPKGYVGNSGMFEIGYALARDKPVYAQEPADFTALAEGDLDHKSYLASNVIVAGGGGSNLYRTRSPRGNDLNQSRYYIRPNPLPCIDVGAAFNRKLGVRHDDVSGVGGGVPLDMYILGAVRYGIHNAAAGRRADEQVVANT